MSLTLNDRVNAVISALMLQNKQFTILDITKAVRSDGGDGAIPHRIIRDIAKPVLDNILIKALGTYAVAQIVVETDTIPVQALLYHPINTNPEDYTDRKRRTAISDRNEFLTKYAHAAAVIAIVADRLGTDPNNLFPDTDILKELDADSLDAAELHMDLEDKFGIKVDDALVADVTTVRKMVELIESNVNKPNTVTASPTVSSANANSAASIPACVANAKWWKKATLRSDGALEIPKAAMQVAFLGSIPSAVDVIVHPNSISLVPGRTLITAHGLRISKNTLANIVKPTTKEVVICAFANKIVLC